MESNGVLGSERSAATRDKLCALLMANTIYINDLPPRELPNPSPDTYASDLVAIQDLLLGGRVELHCNTEQSMGISDGFCLS